MDRGRLAQAARRLCERLGAHRTAFTDEDGAVWPVKRCPFCMDIRNTFVRLTAERAAGKEGR